MNAKPISPTLHGIIDYAFAASLLLGPSLFRFNKKARRWYRFVAFEVVLYSALTDYPAGIKPVISFHTHRDIDYANIAELVAGTMCKDINEDKRVLRFNIGVTAMAMATVLLTDWNADPYLV